MSNTNIINTAYAVLNTLGTGHYFKFWVGYLGMGKTVWSHIVISYSNHSVWCVKFKCTGYNKSIDY